MLRGHTVTFSSYCPGLHGLAGCPSNQRCQCLAWCLLLGIFEVRRLDSIEAQTVAEHVSSF